MARGGYSMTLQEEKDILLEMIGRLSERLSIPIKLVGEDYKIDRLRDIYSDLCDTQEAQ
jgi:hypothetical protein